MAQRKRKPQQNLQQQERKTQRKKQKRNQNYDDDEEENNNMQVEQQEENKEEEKLDNSQEDADYQLALRLQKEEDEMQLQNQNQQTQQQLQEEEEQTQPRRSRRARGQQQYNVDAIIDQQLEDQEIQIQQYSQLTEAQKLQNRIDRAQNQRIYLMKAEWITENYWSFLVKGSQNKNYTLEISVEALKCQCHDFRTRKKTCKHILFIIARIAQNGDLLKNIKSKPKLSPQQFKILETSLLNRLKQRLSGDKKHGESVNIEELGEDSDCPICFDKLDNNDIECCKDGCKKYIHSSCMKLWLDTHNTCPLCRNNWPVSEDKVEDAFKIIKNNNIQIN